MFTLHMSIVFFVSIIVFAGGRVGGVWRVVRSVSLFTYPDPNVT